VAVLRLGIAAIAACNAPATGGPVTADVGHPEAAIVACSSAQECGARRPDASVGAYCCLDGTCRLRRDRRGPIPLVPYADSVDASAE